MTTTLTPQKLIKFLDRHYDENYKITEAIAIKVIQECNSEYDGDFTEDELIEVVENYLNQEDSATNSEVTTTKIIYAKGKRTKKNHKSNIVKSVLLVSTIILILILGILKVNYLNNNSTVKAQGTQITIPNNTFNSTNINTTNSLNNSLEAMTTSTKHITEIITLVTVSIYNPLTNSYLNSCQDEDGEIYKYYSDKNIFDTWQVLIIDTKGTNDLSDDEVINSYNLDNYTFNNDISNDNNN